MRRLSLRIGLGACALAMALPLIADAQAPFTGAVTGSGTAEIQRRAEVLRVQVEVLARGANLKEALAKLKDRRDAARAQLLALGAAKDAIEFGMARLSSAKTPQEQQMEQMLKERMRSGSKKVAPKKESPPPVVVGALLKVDLPLQGTSPEELLLAAEALRAKVKAADLAGMKELNKMTPQEEEVAEELEGMRGRYGNDDGPKRGEPVFFYVAKVSEEERAKALAEAFQKAKKDAARLARAAGQELGPLNHLNSTSALAPPDPDDSTSYPGRYPPWMRERFSPGGDDWSGEAIGSQPGKVSVRVAVTASFALRLAGK